MALSGARFNASLRIKGNVFSEESVFQQPVLAIQTDNTLDPGASPATGDRYLITNSGDLNANFNTITGVGNGDIVEFDGSAFVVVHDVSAVGDGGYVFDQDSNTYYTSIGGSWAAADHPDGGDGITFNSGANRFDLDLADTTPGLELTAADGTGELQLSAQGDGIAGGAGSLLSVDPATEVAGSRAAVYVGADGVGIDLDDSSLDHASSVLQVKDLGISTAKLADDSVTAAKLNADVAGLGLSQAAGGELDVNVDASTLEINADTLRVAASGITSNELADDAVTSAKILTDAVGSDALNYSDAALRSGSATASFTGGADQTFTHNWATTDVSVEVFDSVTGESVFVDSIARASNSVTISVNQEPTNDLRILLREVGAQTTISVS